MITWLLSLSPVLLILVVVAATGAVAGVIYLTVVRLGSGERLLTMSSLSPGLLSPLGVIFGLTVAFLASGIWSNAGTAQTAVNSEASSLRSAVLLMQAFPAAPDRQLQILVARQIDNAVQHEWPAMASGSADLSTVPVALNQALRLALRLTPRNPGQVDAQRELITQLEGAFDARRTRIIASHTQVNAVKWAAVMLLGLLLLIGIALIQAARRGTTAISLALLGTAVALALVLLVTQDRPFSGPFAIRPIALEQVRPHV